MQPRLSLIVAIDSNGQLYFSLSQANNNSVTMILFLQMLIEKLDKERPGWRRSTILLIDNAPYHTSEQVFQFYKSEKLPIMFTGPHSYDAAPIELLFASLKSVDLNPEGLQTSKSKFSVSISKFVEYFL